MLSVIDCLATLVAAGESERCDAFLAELRVDLVAPSSTGEARVAVLKRDAREHPEYRAICLDTNRLIARTVAPIDPFYFGNRRPITEKPRRPGVDS